MFLLFQDGRDAVDFADITARRQPGRRRSSQTLWLGQPVAFWAALFLFIGASGKSAQIPLYVWLPDAMAGPTPVSALIHAATMVTAGVYMVARMSFLYALSPTAMAIVALVGAADRAVRGVHRLRADRPQEGAGLLDGEPARLHVRRRRHRQLRRRRSSTSITHAFFKACLFLGAGSVMHGMSGSGDITTMGGLRKKMPITHGVFLVCCLAICGIPSFAGFFSKDEILAGAFDAHVFDGAGLAWVGKIRRRSADRWPRSAPRSTCGGSTSSSSGRRDARVRGDQAPRPRVAVGR